MLILTLWLTIGASPDVFRTDFLRFLWGKMASIIVKDSIAWNTLAHPGEYV